MGHSQKSSQASDSPQRKAIQAWERRRKLRPFYAAAGFFLLVTAHGMRRMTGVGKFFCIAFAFSGVVLIGLGSWQARIGDRRCPVCGHFMGGSSRQEVHCSICGFTHYDF